MDSFCLKDILEEEGTLPASGTDPILNFDRSKRIRNTKSCAQVCFVQGSEHNRFEAVIHIDVDRKLLRQWQGRCGHAAQDLIKPIFPEPGNV